MTTTLKWLNMYANFNPRNLSHPCSIRFGLQGGSKVTSTATLTKACPNLFAQPCASDTFNISRTAQGTQRVCALP